MASYGPVSSSMVFYGPVWYCMVHHSEPSGEGGCRLKKMEFYEMHSIVITFVFNYFMWRNFLLLENLNLKLLEYFQTKFES